MYYKRKIYTNYYVSSRTKLRYGNYPFIIIYNRIINRFKIQL